MAKHRHGQNSRQRCSTQDHRRAPCCPSTSSASQHYRTHREAFGNLMQEYSEKDDPPKSVRNQESRGDGNAVKECMNDESQQHRVSLVRMHELRSEEHTSELQSPCNL